MKHIYYWLGNISWKLSELLNSEFWGDRYQYFMDKHGALCWQDPDDAPEITKEMLERADFYKNGKLVKKGER